MNAFVNVDGHAVIRLELHVPNVGPWWADAVFESEPELAGAVVLGIGTRSLRGTIVEGGTYGLQRRVRIVAGAGGWGTLLTPQHFHSDSGVRAFVVAQSLASAAGETLGTFEPEVDVVGADYVRQATTAARALEDVIGRVAWWVDYDGVTHVGERAEVSLTGDEYQLLHLDPLEQLATLSVEDVGAIPIGAQLVDVGTVRELRVTIDADRLEVVAWVGGNETSRGRLAEELVRIVRHVNSRSLFGKYRYRVVQLSGDRLELQRVAQLPGLPDAIPVATRPGVSGAHAKPALGSIVYVEFIEGRRTMPIVVAFAGKDESNHAPSELDFIVSTTLRLGSASASEGVPLGTSLKTWLDTHTHGYLGDSGVPANTTGPVETAYAGGSGVPNPSPSPSSKVRVS